jgi:NitT/TauT family transport system substrate-binding protein
LRFPAYQQAEGPGVTLGTMTDAKWASFFDMASGLGVYPKTLDYKSAYSLAFLP